VREAFRERGWNAWSVDLEPTEIPGQHIQGDVLEVLANPVRFGIPATIDLLGCHPPCTYLANSSCKHLYIGAKKENGRDEVRWDLMRRGAEFFRTLWHHPAAARVYVENPIIMGYAREIIGAWPTQTIQPWMFGHHEVKATCLWLRNLPPLVPTKDVQAETMAMDYRDRAKKHLASPSPDRWKFRSRTYAGVAEAMAAQWTGLPAWRYGGEWLLPAA
jgi:hypothetical protein